MKIAVVILSLCVFMSDLIEAAVPGDICEIPKAAFDGADEPARQTEFRNGASDVARKAICKAAADAQKDIVTDVRKFITTALTSDTKLVIRLSEVLQDLAEETSMSNVELNVASL